LYGKTSASAYAESRANELSQQAVAYINVDIGVSGWNFAAEGTATLSSLMEGVAASVKYPGNSGSVLDNWNSPFDNLGSGSDYVAFLHHLGIASVDIRFQNMSDGVYHSIYDSFHWMEKFGDPEFTYHQAISQIFGLVGLRIADAEVLPYNYTSYATRLRGYVEVIRNLIEAVNGTSQVKVDAISSAINSFYGVALKVEQEKLDQSHHPDPAVLLKINDRLVQTERQFLYKEGLPQRPWFRHVVQAPGLYTGYSYDAFPGLAHAIRAKDWDLARQQAEIIAVHIAGASAALLGSSTSPPNKDQQDTIIIIAIVVPVGVIVLAALAVYVYRQKQRQVYSPV